jgi:hypothetical protein
MLRKGNVKPFVTAAFAPINPHWARVVDYGPFSLCVFHKEGRCPSSRDIDMLLMILVRHYGPVIRSALLRHNLNAPEA